MRRVWPILCAGLLIPGCGQEPGGASGKAAPVVAGNFQQEVLMSANPVLVDFWGEG